MRRNRPSWDAPSFGLTVWHSYVNMSFDILTFDNHVDMQKSNSAGREFFPWHSSVVETRDWARSDLYITQASMRLILELFHIKYNLLIIII